MKISIRYSNFFTINFVYKIVQKLYDEIIFSDFINIFNLHNPPLYKIMIKRTLNDNHFKSQQIMQKSIPCCTLCTLDSYIWIYQRRYCKATNKTLWIGKIMNMFLVWGTSYYFRKRITIFCVSSQLCTKFWL